MTLRCDLSLRPADKTVCFTLTWARVDGEVFAAQIHPGVAGDAGGVLVPLFGPGSFGSQGAQHGCVTTSAANIAASLANPEAFYVNVHSTAPAGFPAGALRGQLE